jgi:hypothetical protein
VRYFSNSQNSGRDLRPPDLYEYFVDNFWFKAADLENQRINEPLRGAHKSDVVIVGGGFTRLSSAFHIKEKFPEKKIVVLEGACCGTTAYTLGGKPSVGVMGEHNNINYGVGLSEGVPSTQRSGRIIADLVAGESNEFTTHYIVNRMIPYAGPNSMRSMFARGTKWMLKRSK